MTPEQKIITAGIDFAARCRETARVMEREYVKRYHENIPDGQHGECVGAWEAAILAIVGFTGECERLLTRMTLLACGRTPEMLKADQNIDAESLQKQGPCAIRTDNFIVTVGYSWEDDEARMTAVPIVNLIEDRPGSEPPRAAFIRRNPNRKPAA